ncbi:hypothetical protein FACS1894187_18230 [Synergistales bacterium]|nr:hypothetical protein FACS1894187_18230 [Synergistales bacterium]
MKRPWYYIDGKLTAFGNSLYIQKLSSDEIRVLLVRYEQDKTGLITRTLNRVYGNKIIVGALNETVIGGYYDNCKGFRNTHIG